MADPCTPDFCARDDRSGLDSDALNVLLQPLLSCFVETNELDAHPEGQRVFGSVPVCSLNYFWDTEIQLRCVRES